MFCIFKQVGGKINKIHCCNITTKGAVDIENLATITCSNKESISREDDRWLIRGRTETSLEQSLAGILNIADICCANEPCKCFNECICKEKCSQKALEKQAYLNCNFEADKNIFLRKTTRRLNSDDDIWLRKSVFDTETECEKSWLKIDTITNSEKMDISEKGEVNESTLSQDTAADKEFKDISDKFDVLPLYNDNKLWVKCSQIPLIFESFSFIREDFQPYFLCNDVNTWLSS